MTQQVWKSNMTWGDPIIGETTQTFNYTSKTSSHLGIYISLKMFVNWNSNFLKIYKIVKGSGRVAIAFSNCTGINTLDHTRTRFANGEPDTNPSYLVNAISFTSQVTVGTLIEIEYKESKNLNYNIQLVPMGWDFDNFQPYGGIGIDWLDPEGPIAELYSKAIPTNLSGGKVTLKEIGNFVNRVNLPSYLPTTYLINGTDEKEVRFLTPNVLIDHFSPLEFDYSSINLRVEAFQFPRNQRKEYDNTRSIPYSKFNFMGYWTAVPMKTLLVTSVGYRCKYLEVGYRLRNMVTNSISDWLPIKLYIRRGFRPNKSISMVDKQEAILVKYSF